MKRSSVRPARVLASGRIQRAWGPTPRPDFFCGPRGLSGERSFRRPTSVSYRRNAAEIVAAASRSDAYPAIRLTQLGMAAERQTVLRLLPRGSAERYEADYLRPERLKAHDDRARQSGGSGYVRVFHDGRHAAARRATRL